MLVYAKTDCFLCTRLSNGPVSFPNNSHQLGQCLGQCRVNECVSAWIYKWLTSHQVIPGLLERQPEVSLILAANMDNFWVLFLLCSLPSLCCQGTVSFVLTSQFCPLFSTYHVMTAQQFVYQMVQYLESQFFKALSSYQHHNFCSQVRTGQFYKDEAHGTPLDSETFVNVDFWLTTVLLKG